MIYALMPAIFIAAILCIAFEDKIKINKAAVAISSAILLWSMLFMSADGILGNGYSEAFADFIQSAVDSGDVAARPLLLFS